MCDLHLREKLDQNGVRSVVFGAARGRHPARHLQLHHETQRVKALSLLQQLKDERRGNVVGQVGDELVGRRPERLVVEAEGVRFVNDDVVEAPDSPAQLRRHVRVEFDRVYQLRRLREEGRKEASPRSDLEDDVVPRHPLRDYTGGVRIL